MLAGSLLAHVRYDATLKKWRYLQSFATWVDIPGGSQDLRLDLDTWHQLQLEVNFATKKFVSLKVGPLEVDMSTIDLYEVGAATTEYAELKIECSAVPDKIIDAWVDDVFVEVW